MKLLVASDADEHKDRVLLVHDITPQLRNRLNCRSRLDEVHSPIPLTCFVAWSDDQPSRTVSAKEQFLGRGFFWSGPRQSYPPTTLEKWALIEFAAGTVVNPVAIALIEAGLRTEPPD